jgi:hypothetical protein
VSAACRTASAAARACPHTRAVTEAGRAAEGDVGLERLLAPPPQPATSPQHNNRMEIVHRLIEALDLTV